MIRYLLGIVLFISVFSFSACKDDETKAEPYLNVEETLLQLDEKTQQTTIDVNTNIDDWDVTSTDEKWCIAARLMTSGNRVQIYVSENKDTDLRKASVFIEGGSFKHEIKVEQLGSAPGILLTKDTLLVDAAGATRQITATANITYDVKLSDNGWITEAPRGRVTTTTYTFNMDENSRYEARFDTIVFRSTDAAAPQLEVKLPVMQNATPSSPGEVEVEGDPHIIPTGGLANQYQPGQNIENTWDGKFAADGGAPYHSPWGAPYGDETVFPVVLEYFFDGGETLPEQIDYLIYYTRSGNGNFGEVEIWVSTEAQPEYTKYGDYDFQMKNSPSKVVFTDGLVRPKKIKFVVKTGAGGFASCDEMEFYAKKTGGALEDQLLTVFTDITCSQLKTGVTDAQIDALPGYFSEIALKMKRGEYETEFRIYDYPAYSVAEDWADRLLTKEYGILDNTTGIYANAGDEIIVLVGDTHGQEISLLSIADGDVSGDSYFLSEGVNKLAIRNTGLLYVMYHTDLSSPRALPIRIHIPMGSGRVNGYFDLEEHKTDAKYAELLSKSTYKYFTIKGRNIMMTFHTNRLRQYVPNSIIPTIEMWDNVIAWQLSLMGIENERGQLWNNRLFASSFEGEGYMWATNYRTGFHENTLYKILVPETMMEDKDNMWGPAHEIGHINQFAINWPGCSESSNNLFSNYVIFKFGKFCSRGTALSELNNYRVVQDQPFTLISGATHQGENTELHMRMNWQLFVYFHRVLGDEQFWPRLFKLLRQTPPVESNPGWSQLNFAEQACAAANLDLTDFFEMWGFFVPVDNVPYEQYGNWTLNVTPAMIAETKARIAAKRYRKPAHVIQYIEDRKQNDTGNVDEVGDVGYWTQFRDNQRITKNVTYKLSGTAIRITNGEEAVAFELRDAQDKLIWFSNFLNFEVSSSVLDKMDKIYAVQANGTRITVVTGN